MQGSAVTVHTAHQLICHLYAYVLWSLVLGCFGLWSNPGFDQVLNFSGHLADFRLYKTGLGAQNRVLK